MEISGGHFYTDYPVTLFALSKFVNAIEFFEGGNSERKQLAG